MKRLLVVSLMAMGMFTSSGGTARADCYPPNCWGAIAVGTHNGAWAWVTNHPTAGSARQRALWKCHGRCNRSLVFRNSCGAYAIPATRGGGYGWATRYTRYAAQRAALYQCRRYNPGQGCRVLVWACTTRR
jgi:hypothetical protein